MVVTVNLVECYHLLPVLLNCMTLLPPHALHIFLVCPVAVHITLALWSRRLSICFIVF